MTVRQSAYLDLLRVVAAFAVVFGHIALWRFSGERYNTMRGHAFASDAVIVFFVLSGFIMAFVTTQRNRGAANFAMSRATRILSVAVPALILTVLVDRWGYAIAPDFYARYIIPDPGVSVEEAVRALSFSTHWWELRLPPGSNAPWWSLSYEVSYYVMFGLWVFARGWLRWGLLALAALVVGPNTLLLMPAFIIGVWLHGHLRGAAERPQDRGMSIALSALPVGTYAMLHMGNVPKTLEAWTTQAVTAEMGWALQFSSNFVWAAVVAVLVAVHIRGMWRLLSAEGRGTAPWVKPVKWLAGGTFSLYLVHFPLLHLIEVGLPTSGSARLDDVVMGAVAVLACYLFAEAFERPLPRFRAALRKLFQTRKRPLRERALEAG